jgi:hypothetical protein
MADNNENILVEFDYQNIFIADPNKVIDSEGKPKDRNIKHENLIMYANLECNLIPRTKLALGAGSTEIQTISLAKINFLNPTNEKLLNNKYVTFNSNITTPPKPADPDTGLEENDVQGPPKIVESSLLGITQINVRTTFSYVAEVNMVLEDVRGRALFELGDKSPYAAFFNMPYPKFYLTLKGYLGKAIRYELSLQTFNGSFDAETGNFIIRLKFLAYQYSMLSEVIMNYMYALPYMYKKNLQIKQPATNPLNNLSNLRDVTTYKGLDKLSSLYNEYKSKKLIPEDFPVLTIPDLQRKLDSFIKNVLTTFGKVNLQPLTDLDTYTNDLDIFQKDVVYYLPNSWVNTYLDQEGFYVLNNGTKVYQLKKEFRDESDKTIDATKELIKKLNENNQKLNDNIECGKNKKSEVKNLLEIGSNPSKKSGLPDWIEFKLSTNDVNFKTTFEQRTNKSSIVFSAESEQFLNDNFKIIDANYVSTGVTAFYYAFEGTIGNSPTFIERAKSMSKDLIDKKNLIIRKKSEELNEVLKNGNSGGAGLGFIPTIRNVLAVFFANAEAYLRLMDDVHNLAWNVRDSEIRKSIVLDKTSSVGSVDSINEFVYPWPQVTTQRTVDNETAFEVVYPGNTDMATRTQAYRFDVWPEVEFLEEMLKGFTQKLIQDSSGGENSTDPTIGVASRLSLNSVEFPFSNESYSNKAEVNFIYEIWERLGLLTNITRFSRGNAQSQGIHELIGTTEFNNISTALQSGDIFLVKKLKDLGINASNIINTLRHISNQGQGKSWQQFIRGLYTIPYLGNYTKQTITGSAQDWYFYDNTIFKKLDDPNQASIQLENIDKIKNYITDTANNATDILDVFPFNNKESIKTNVANGQNLESIESFFQTRNIIQYDEIKKVVSNYQKDTTTKTKRPYTHYNFEGLTNPNFGDSKTNQNTQFVKNFYNQRTTDSSRKNQFVTEGSIYYSNYSGQVSTVQSTSIFNTPYFTNAIQDSADKIRFGTSVYPFVKPAYLFLNSLPLSTLSEKYKTFANDSETELDYIFSCFKKYSGIHRIPYAMVLKYGSIWHRYKKYVETGEDILDDIWTDFNYLKNYDPQNSASTKTYIFTGFNSTEVFDITLQKQISNSETIKDEINLGFYPQIINDFARVLNDRDAFTSNTYTNETIQDGVNKGLIFKVDSFINADKGFDETNTGRTLSISSYSNYLYNESENKLFLLPSVGNQFNQTLNECFTRVDSTTNQPLLDTEILNNPNMYNGSTRLFWAAPNYGYFDNSILTKPKFNEYIKTIFNTINDQDNFSFNGNDSYSLIQDVLPTFKKTILDYFESLFLKFSKSKFDFESITDAPADPSAKSNGDKIYSNFHILFQTINKIDSSSNQSDLTNINRSKELQLNNYQTIIGGFLTYDILLKIGNPSEYYKTLYLSFINATGGVLGSQRLQDPIKFPSYNTTTPNVLPSTSNNVTIESLKQSYPNEWEVLQLYIGYTNQNNIGYSNSGSTIFDFFIDNDIAFTVNNIEVLYPLIRIYATQKANDGTYNYTKFISDLSSYVEKINKLQDDSFNYLFTKLNASLPTVNETSVSTISSQIIGDQAKNELWETLKAFNDKWIAGNDLNFKTLFEDVMLLDRASRDIGNQILVDVTRLNQSLNNMNRSGNVLGYVKNILQENNFQMLALPSYVNFYNVQDVTSNPEPRLEGSLEFANTLFGTFKSVDYRNSSSKMVCLYAGKPSEHLDVKGDYRFNNDGFDLKRTGQVPIIENQSGKKDWAISNRVVGFNVDIGTNNQSIFTNFSVSQEAGKATSESMAAITALGNSATSNRSSTQNVSLYNLYKTRSYLCDVKMLGNAMIQPTMYFNLRHVPMFSGPYMILEVEHAVSPGMFQTSFKGIRQSIYSLPKIDSYIQSIRENLISSILKSVKQSNTSSSDGTSNTAQSQINNTQNNAGGLQPSPNQDCKRNNAFLLFEPSTPVIREINFTEAANSITDITSSISNISVKDKIKYAIWSLMYITSSTETGFRGWDWNLGAVRLDIQYEDKEVTYGARRPLFSGKYFCLTNGNIDNSFATFLNLESFMKFMSSTFENRTNSIKNFKSGNTFTLNEDELANEITKFLTNNWPNISTKDIFTEQLNSNNQNLIERINLVKKGIQVAISLSL